ncbi:SurA N-terminal domain-containing protein [Pusillimonas sp. ANT_WB101]|uniref:SurA N-terminal domain-containing protein n=1 Tax=Pusillimonas sp. ANT_WB101 TaxID=2597356 RepID=UPI0011EF015E|nr:SurA N-terminal domain-containing protein [Pusillimonas sp. ANT_WB101]KAA0910947.1 peptidylprolyl isomerase [Pusillimonas sp. ANT_WB101]
MFDFIRTHQRLMQFILLILIVPSFVLIGVSGYSTYVSGDQELIKVGDGAITQQEFDQARSNQLRQLQQSNPGGFDPSVLDNPQTRSALLQSLVDQRVMVETATAERFSVSDTALRQAIASMPELQENGQFSPERYSQILASVGLKSRDFEEGRRAELALDRVLQPVATTAAVPDQVAQRIEQVLTEQRKIRLQVFPSSDYEQALNITDADIQAWYDKNKHTLQLPDQVSAEYLLLNEKAAMSNLPTVSDADLHAYYEQNKGKYIQPARVNVSHIQINVPAGASGGQRQSAHEKASEIARKLKADPASFADVAKAQSEDAGTAKSGGKLGWVTKGSWPANLEDAVFALKQGAVSGVIDGPGGFHIFQVNEIQAEHGETFEEAHDKVEAEVRRQLGADRFAEMATKLTDLVYDNPTSLQPAAESLGLKIKKVDGIARDQLLPSDQVSGDAASASEDAGILSDVRVRRSLFSAQSLNDKANTGVIEISPSAMLVLRVDKLTPAHVPELAQVSDHIRETLRHERALEAASKAGEAALTTYKAAQPGDIPEGFGSPLEISRINTQNVEKPVIDAAFTAATSSLPTYVGVEGAQGYTLVRIEQATPGTFGTSMLASLKNDLSAAWGHKERQAVLEAMREQLGVKVLPEGEAAIAGEGESTDK